METNKQWKRVPFTIELAKKIQSGEVKGKIVTQDNEPVRIVCFDKKSTNKREAYQVVALVEANGHECLIICGENGLCWDAEYDCNRSLHIELPEETREQHRRTELPDAFQHARDAGYLEGFEDALKLRGEVRCTENTEEKHEFKPFDKVLVRYPDKTELCAPNSAWLPGIFQYKSVNSNLYFVSGKAYKDCIPYEGNEHLVGTTNNPE